MEQISSAVWIQQKRSYPLLALEITLSGKGTACPGSNDGAVFVDFPVGQAPYEIRYNDGPWMTGEEITGLFAGTYTVEARDAAGCLASGMITLEDPEPMEVFIATKDPFCVGSCDGEVAFLSVGGQGPYLYYVDEALRDSVATGFCAGTFKVDVLDAKGCHWSSAFTLEDPDPFEIELGKNRKVMEGNPSRLNSSRMLNWIRWSGMASANQVVGRNDPHPG